MPILKLTDHGVLSASRLLVDFPWFGFEIPEAVDLFGEFGIVRDNAEFPEYLR
jgi:hypothetical protein